MKKALTIEIDGNEVSLRGTSKGDGAFEALKGTAWRWGGRAQAFVLPRNLQPGTRQRNINSAKAALEVAGFEVEVEDTGVQLTVAEEREQERERLEARAERYADRAQRRGAEAEARYAAEHALLDPIPFGQPNIGGRLTSVYRRAEQHRVAAHEAAQVAEHAAERAANIERRLDRGTPTPTLLRRIKKNEAELRDIDRRITGEGGNSRYVTRKPATGEYLERLQGLRERVVEALELDRAEVQRRTEEDGVRVWGPDDFQVGDEAAYWGGWAAVKRVNKKSLTVPSGYSWDQTVTYDKIIARRRDGVVTR